MTIEQLLGKSTADLEAMSDEQIVVYFSEMDKKHSRPPSGTTSLKKEKPKSKRQLKKEAEEQAAKILAELGLTMPIIKP